MRIRVVLIFFCLCFYFSLAKKDLYQILGVNRNASPKAIRQAYRKLARKLHPDVSGKDTKAKFVEVQQAYDVLSDQDHKAHYDRYGTLPGQQQAAHSSQYHPFQGASGFPPGFGAQFGGGTFRFHTGGFGRQRSADLPKSSVATLEPGDLARAAFSPTAVPVPGFASLSKAADSGVIGLVGEGTVLLHVLDPSFSRAEPLTASMETVANGLAQVVGVGRLAASSDSGWLIAKEFGHLLGIASHLVFLAPARLHRPLFLEDAVEPADSAADGAALSAAASFELPVVTDLSVDDARTFVQEGLVALLTPSWTEAAFEAFGMFVSRLLRSLRSAPATLQPLHTYRSYRPNADACYATVEAASSAAVTFGSAAPVVLMTDARADYVHCAAAAFALRHTAPVVCVPRGVPCGGLIPVNDRGDTIYSVRYVDESLSSIPAFSQHSPHSRLRGAFLTLPTVVKHGSRTAAVLPLSPSGVTFFLRHAKTGPRHLLHFVLVPSPAHVEALLRACPASSPLAPPMWVPLDTSSASVLPFADAFNCMSSKRCRGTECSSAAQVKYCVVTITVPGQAPSTSTGKVRKSIGFSSVRLSSAVADSLDAAVRDPTTTDALGTLLEQMTKGPCEHLHGRSQPTNLMPVKRVVSLAADIYYDDSVALFVFRCVSWIRWCCGITYYIRLIPWPLVWAVLGQVGPMLAFFTLACCCLCCPCFNRRPPPVSTQFAGDRRAPPDLSARAVDAAAARLLGNRFVPKVVPGSAVLAVVVLRSHGALSLDRLARGLWPRKTNAGYYGGLDVHDVFISSHPNTSSSAKLASTWTQYLLKCGLPNMPDLLHTQCHRGGSDSGFSVLQSDGTQTVASCSCSWIAVVAFRLRAKGSVAVCLTPDSGAGVPYDAWFNSTLESLCSVNAGGFAIEFYRVPQPPMSSF